MKVAAATVPARSTAQIGEDRSQWAVIAGIALLALGLRLYQLGSENLWTDEWLSLGDADHPGIVNRHRPLFYLLLHRWCRFLSVTGLLHAGDGWVRLPAVFFGVAAVVLLYLLGRRLAGAPAAIVACLIMAVSVPELDHSQELRNSVMAELATSDQALHPAAEAHLGNYRVLSRQASNGFSPVCLRAASANNPQLQ